MIVSHLYKFIYIKTIKTASTSIETALSEICGPDDIVTPTAERYMKHRKGIKAQNYRLQHPAVPKRTLRQRLFRRPERYFHPSVGYYEHMPAWRIRTYIGETIWNDYFKFTFERNPWDRQVSFYHFRCLDRNKHKCFESFLKRKSASMVDNYGLYSIDGKPCVDFLGKYEDLTSGFEYIKDRLNLPHSLSLPVVNSSSHAGRYREYYNERTKSIIEKRHKAEIELLGYEF